MSSTQNSAKTVKGLCVPRSPSQQSACQELICQGVEESGAPSTPAVTTANYGPDPSGDGATGNGQATASPETRAAFLTEAGERGQGQRRSLSKSPPVPQHKSPSCHLQGASIAAYLYIQEQSHISEDARKWPQHRMLCDLPMTHLSARLGGAMDFISWHPSLANRN